MCYDLSEPPSPNDPTMPIRDRKYRRGTSTSSPPTFMLYNPSTRAYSAQPVSIAPQSHCDSTTPCLPFSPMTGLQKLYSKVMKRSQRHAVMASSITTKQNGQSNHWERRPSKLRSSRNLPSNNEPTRLKPVYRGSTPLKKSDIHLVVDISPESIREYNDEHAWPNSPTLSPGVSDHKEQGRGDPEELAVRRRPSPIDTDVLNSFPTPPNFHAHFTSGARVLEPSASGSKSPCTSVSSYEFPYSSPEDLISPNPYFQRSEEEPGLERWPIEASFYPRQVTLQRACSASAAYCRSMQKRFPSSSASTSTHSTSLAYQRREPASASSSWYPTSSPSHKSTLSLDADVRLNPGPIQRRPLVIRQHCAHDSSFSAPSPIPSPKLAAPRKIAYSLTSGATVPQASPFQPAHKTGASDGVLNGGGSRTKMRLNPTALTTAEAFGPRMNGRRYVFSTAT
jgi:hypothetical protein